MPTRVIIELAIAAIVFGIGIWMYRKRSVGAGAPDGGYGSQGAVLLFVIGLIIAVHAFGLMNYRPTADEQNAMIEGSR